MDGGFFTGGKAARGVTTNNLHLVPRLRMSGVVPTSPVCFYCYVVAIVLEKVLSHFCPENGGSLFLLHVANPPTKLHSVITQNNKCMHNVI